MDYKDYKDYSQRDYFFRMQQMRQMQMPFSLMYPYPDLYMSEIETDRDLQYLQQMYPMDAKKIQKKVEEECDKLEYEGSMMYDEYPDRVSMLLICDRIADALAREEAEKQAVAEAGEADADAGEEMNAMQMRRPDFDPGAQRPPFGPDRRPPRPQDQKPGPSFDPGRRNLLEVLLYNEMYKRRCKHRRERRFW